MSHKKTVEQHKQNGTYRPGKHLDNIEIISLDSIPSAPVSLGKYGKKEWNRMVKNLIENNLVSGLDIGLLQLACSEFNIYRECQEFLVAKNHGVRNLSVANYLHGKNSQTAMVRTEMKQSFRNYFDVITKFGVTPSERAKIPAGKKQEKPDEFDQFEEDMEL